MADPATTGTIVASTIATIGGFLGGGGGRGIKATFEQAISATRRRPPAPTPTPEPRVPDVVTGPVVSGAVSIGQRTPDEFISLSRELVAGRLPFPEARIPGLPAILPEIIRKIPDIIRRVPKRPAPPKPKPAPPEKPKPKLPPRDPRFGKDKPKVRRGRIERQPDEVGPPPPRGAPGRPRPGIRIPRGPVVPGTVPEIEVIPEVVSTPVTKPAPAPLPAPRPRAVPALVPAFIGLAAGVVGLGVAQRLGRASGRAPRTGRQRPTVPQPVTPLAPFQPTLSPFPATASRLALRETAIGQDTASRLRRQLRECRSQAARCEKKRRKRRRTCWKGYFVESSSRTRFKKWFKVDCRTGRQLKSKQQPATRRASEKRRAKTNRQRKSANGR